MPISVADPSETAVSRKLQRIFLDFLRDSAAMFDECGFLDDCALGVRELEKGVLRPFNIAVFGRMKNGKSSIVNALLGRDLAITGTEETTATLNVITKAEDSGKCGIFTIHRKDGRIEDCPVSRLLAEWTGKSQAVKERVANTSFLQLYSDNPMLSLCEVTDTPGTGSSVAEHEQVSRDFLDMSIREGRKADALIYVFGVTGRQSDEEYLARFRDGCLNSRPDNSVGVMHIWDSTYWDSNGNWSDILAKADRLKTQMSSVVADVIPVSAPLAMLAARASEELLAAILERARFEGESGLKSNLSIDRRWNMDDSRRRLMQELASVCPPRFPIECVRVLFLEAVRLPKTATPATLRKRLADLGGIDRLRDFIDRNFFRNAAIIRQRQQHRKFLRLKEEAYRRIDDFIALLARTKGHEGEIERIRARAEALDSRIINSGAPKLLADMDALDWCKANPKLVSEEEVSSLSVLSEWFADSPNIALDRGRLQSIKSHLSMLRLGILDAAGRKSANHLIRRIDAALSVNGRRN